MCTVTYIPVKDKIFITHNRDEKSARSKAIHPKEYVVNGFRLLFPRDSHAGGTWIALNDNGTAAVLLNGGFEKHVHKPPYRKSRGLCFLDIICSDDLYYSFNRVNLDNIEPFTIILWNHGDLYECRWDGIQKYSLKLDPGQSYSWSSVTLYDNDVRDKRSDWFNNWFTENPTPSLEDIMHFHLFGGEGDAHNNLRMNRNNVMLTVSITAMEISPDNSIMKYTDLQDNTSTMQQWMFTKSPVSR
jgi:Transport and Golgi organisation 2